MAILILDVGGVLVDHDNALLLRNLAALIGGDPATILPTFRDAGLGVGRRSAEAIYADLAAERGAKIDVEAFRAAWSSHFTPKPEMLAFAREKAREGRLALCSNSNAAHWDGLNALYGLGALGPAILSHQVGVEKPAEEIFRLAARALDVDPRDCLMVDDQEAYLAGATAIGMRVHVFRGREGLERALAAA